MTLMLKNQKKQTQSKTHALEHEKEALLFSECMAYTKLSVEKDPWIKGAHLSGYCKYLIEEAHEVLSALEKNDTDNLKEELGDIISLWAILSCLAEDKKLFTASDVLTDAIKKIKRRRPYILDQSAKPITKAESHSIWMQVKAEEQNEKRKKK